MFKKKADDQAGRARATGSGGDLADAAVDGRHKPADHHPDAPHARAVKPLPAHIKADQLRAKEKVSENRQEALLDEAIEESFPGSDPISPSKVD